MFPAFCISLPETPDRWKAAEKRFKPHLKVTMFAGIHGKKCGLSHATGKMAPGQVGCYLSHFMLWTHILHSGIPKAIIFEDDAQVDDNWESLSGMMDRIPDPEWDAIFLGAAVYPLQANRFWYRVIRAMPNHAYIVRANTLAALISENRQAGTDTDFWVRTFSTLRCWAICPPLVGQSVFGGPKSLTQGDESR